MSIRAKFCLTHVTETTWGSPGCKVLKFNAQYDQSIPEDQRYCKATPSGTIEMQVDNPAALEQFKLGEYYYLDFTPAPKP